MFLALPKFLVTFTFIKNVIYYFLSFSCVCVCVGACSLQRTHSCLCVCLCLLVTKQGRIKMSPYETPHAGARSTKCDRMVTLSGWLLNLSLGEYLLSPLPSPAPPPPPPYPCPACQCVRRYQMQRTLECMFRLPPEGDTLIQEISPKV